MKRAIGAEHVKCNLCGDYTRGVVMAIEVEDDFPHLFGTCMGCLGELLEAARELPATPRRQAQPEPEPADIDVPVTRKATYYGPEWPLIRSRILERDGKECQDEGHKAAGGSRPSDDLVVHHRKPLREFGGDYKAANVEENLITLCTMCHGRWHAELNRQAKAMQQ